MTNRGKNETKMLFKPVSISLNQKQLLLLRQGVQLASRHKIELNRSDIVRCALFVWGRLSASEKITVLSENKRLLK